MHTVTIRNKARRMQVINLPHEIMGTGYVERVVVGSLAWRPNAETGALQKGVRGGVKRCSKSIRLMPAGTEGDQVHDLPPRVVECPDVKALLRSRPPQIEVVEFTEDEAKAAAQKREARAAAKVARAEANAEHQKRKREAKIKRALALASGQKPPPKFGGKGKPQAAAAPAAQPEPPAAAEAEEPAPKRRTRNDK